MHSDSRFYIYIHVHLYEHLLSLFIGKKNTDGRVGIIFVCILAYNYKILP